jgi:hypothetical protein
MIIIMEAGKGTTTETQKSSLDIARILIAFVGMFILAWILLYPAYLIVELFRQLGFAIGGVLIRGDLGGFTITPDIIPWHIAGSITVTKGDEGAGRVLSGPLSNFFLLTLVAAAASIVAGRLKPKTLGWSVVDDFFELLAACAGFAMFAMGRMVADSQAIAAVVNKENSTFIMLFNALQVIVCVIGLAFIVFFVLKWLVELLANSGVAKKSAIWRPYIVAIIAVLIGAGLYFVPAAMIFDFMPYAVFLALGLAMFSQAGFTKKAENAS